MKMYIVFVVRMLLLNKTYSFKLCLENTKVPLDMLSVVSDGSIIPEGTMISNPSIENVSLLKNDLNVSS